MREIKKRERAWLGHLWWEREGRSVGERDGESKCWRGWGKSPYIGPLSDPRSNGWEKLKKTIQRLIINNIPSSENAGETSDFTSAREGTLSISIAPDKAIQRFHQRHSSFLKHTCSISHSAGKDQRLTSGAPALPEPHFSSFLVFFASFCLRSFIRCSNWVIQKPIFNVSMR